MNNTTRQSKVRALALDKKAEIRVYQLSLLVDIIDTACKRGAFTGEEMTKVGAVFDTLKQGLQTAYQLAEREVGEVGDVAEVGDVTVVAEVGDNVAVVADVGDNVVDVAPTIYD